MEAERPGALACPAILPILTVLIISTLEQPGSPSLTLWGSLHVHCTTVNNVKGEASPRPLAALYPKSLGCYGGGSTQAPSPISLQTLLHLRKPDK